MSRAGGLLDAVIQNPDDDTPRLVYADWLDEQGDHARAEFIRVQVEHARTEAWGERAVDLSIRERRLLHENRERWCGELPLFAKLRWHQVEFRRGFPYSLDCTAAQYLKNGPQHARESVIQGWSLTNLGDEAAARIARSRHLSRVRRLVIAGASSEAMRAGLASPHLTGLREFAFRHPCCDAPESVSRLGALFETPALLSVERLGVGHSGLQAVGTPEAVFRAVRGARFTRLRGLAIEFPGPPRAGSPGFAAAPWLPGLIDLDAGTMTDRNIPAVEAIPALPDLKAFRCTVSNVYSGIERLLLAPVLAGVAELSIHGMRDEAVRALLAAPFLERLRVLDCPHVCCSPAEFARLIDSGRLAGLVKLGVIATDPSADGIARAVAQTRGLPNLRHLSDLSRATSDAVVDELTVSPNLLNLRMVTKYLSDDPVCVSRALDA